MSTLDSMLERNRALAVQQSAAGTLMPSLPRALPNVKAIIIGCADMRADPAHVLGIKPGEALVMRKYWRPDHSGVIGTAGAAGKDRSACRRNSRRRRRVSHHRASAH
jgi:carbonic anhydrase